MKIINMNLTHPFPPFYSTLRRCETIGIDSTQVLLSQPRRMIPPIANNKASSSSAFPAFRASQKGKTTSPASRDILPSSRLAFIASQQLARSSQQNQHQQSTQSTRATVEIVNSRASQTTRQSIRQRTPPPPAPSHRRQIGSSSANRVSSDTCLYLLQILLGLVLTPYS